MQVNEYVSEFISGFEKLSNHSQTEIEKYILEFEHIHSNVMDEFYSGITTPEERRTFIKNRLPEYAKSIFKTYIHSFKTRLPVILELVNQTGSRLKASFDKKANLITYILPAMATTDGRSTTINGNISLILNAIHMSRYTDRAIKVFLAHEFFHALHEQNIDFHSVQEGLSNNLHAEGWATYASSIVYPGFEDWFYIDFSAKDDSRVKSYKLNHSEIIRGIKKYLDSTDLTTINNKFFYGDPNGSVPFPPRSGYYVGYLIAKELAKTMPLNELTWITPKIFREMLPGLLDKIEAQSP